MSDTTQAIAQAAASPQEASRAWRVRVVLGFLAIYIIWGSTYLAIRYAVETIPPLYTAGVRHLCAGSILLAWALVKGLRPTWPQIKASIVIGFFFFLVGHGSLHWAERVVPSGLASLLIAVEPIFVFCSHPPPRAHGNSIGCLPPAYCSVWSASEFWFGELFSRPSME